MSTYASLFYQLVFSTKDRRPLITSALETDLHAYLGGIIKGIRGVPIEINGIEDHVHILAMLPKDLSVSFALQKLKSCSSKWVNSKKTNIRGRFKWQRGYGAFSVSKSQVPAVRRYIQNQKEHHKKQDFKAEFRAMLRKNGIDFDERYLWD